MRSNQPRGLRTKLDERRRAGRDFGRLAEAERTARAPPSRTTPARFSATAAPRQISYVRELSQVGLKWSSAPIASSKSLRTSGTPINRGSNR